MNSTVVDRPAIYDTTPPPPPPPARPASSVEAQPVSEFQAFKHEAEEAEEAEGGVSKDEVNRQIFLDAVNATAPRRDWTRKEVSAIYYQPMLELTHQAVSLNTSQGDSGSLLRTFLILQCLFPDYLTVVAHHITPAFANPIPGHPSPTFPRRR